MAKQAYIWDGSVWQSLTAPIANLSLYPTLGGSNTFTGSNTFNTNIFGNTTFSAFTTTDSLTIGKTTGYTGTNTLSNNVLSGGIVQGSAGNLTITDNYSVRNLDASFSDTTLNINIGTGTTAYIPEAQASLNVNIATGIGTGTKTVIIGNSGGSTGIFLYGSVQLPTTTYYNSADITTVFARLGAANAFTVGGHTITTISDTVKPLIISGNASGTQSVNIFEVKTTPSQATPALLVSSTGEVKIGQGPLSVGVGNTVNLPSINGISGANFSIDPYAGNASMSIGVSLTTGTLSIATGGSSATPINIGQSASTITLNGNNVVTGKQYIAITPVAINATTNPITAANILTGMITSTTAAATNATLPTGTNFETAIANANGAPAVGTCFDFSVINTGVSTFTFLTNTGWTLVNSMAVATATSARFRARKTSTNNFTLYRL